MRWPRQDAGVDRASMRRCCSLFQGLPRLRDGLALLAVRAGN